MSEAMHSMSRQLAITLGGSLLLAALIFWLGWMDLVWAAIDGMTDLFRQLFELIW